MYLDFELCDRNQNVLTRLDNRRAGGRVEVPLDDGRRAFCPLSLEDLAYGQADAVETVLRVTGYYADGTSRDLFIGRILIPEQGQEEQGEELGLNAADSLAQLDCALIRTLSVSEDLWTAVFFEGKDQSQIMWALIEAASTHGVIKGSLPASVNRDRTYVPGKEVGLAIREMSEVIGGPDFELEPVRATDGTLCRFNTYYPRQGEDKSADVVFVLGAPPYTATGLQFAPGGDEIVNRVVVIGAPLNLDTEEFPFAIFPAYVAEHAESIGKYGVWEKVIQLEDVTETATLKAHAEAFVAASAFPVPYFDFTVPAEQVDGEEGEGIPPEFGLDYWVGDTIAVQAYLGAADADASGRPLDAAGNLLEPLELKGRITDAVLTEAESGHVSVKLSCSAEVSATGVSGKAISLKVPEGAE